MNGRGNEGERRSQSKNVNETRVGAGGVRSRGSGRRESRRDVAPTAGFAATIAATRFDDIPSNGVRQGGPV
jgi:hypothetical protein